MNTWRTLLHVRRRFAPSAIDIRPVTASNRHLSLARLRPTRLQINLTEIFTEKRRKDLRMSGMKERTIVNYTTSTAEIPKRSFTRTPAHLINKPGENDGYPKEARPGTINLNWPQKRSATSRRKENRSKIFTFSGDSSARPRKDERHNFPSLKKDTNNDLRSLLTENMAEFFYSTFLLSFEHNFFFISFRLPFHALVSIFEFVFNVRSILSHKKAYLKRAQSGGWTTNTQVGSIDITNSVALTTIPVERFEKRKNFNNKTFSTHFVVVIRRRVCFSTVFRISCSFFAVLGRVW